MKSITGGLERKENKSPTPLALCFTIPNNELPLWKLKIHLYF